MSDKENKAIIEVFRELDQGYKQGDVDRCIATFKKKIFLQLEQLFMK